MVEVSLVRGYLQRVVLCEFKLPVISGGIPVLPNLCLLLFYLLNNDQFKLVSYVLSKRSILCFINSSNVGSMGEGE